jgi:hypothetical protein
MEEIMQSVFSKLRFRGTALLLAVVGGLVILVTVYSVQPTASRFDSLAQKLGSVGAANRPMPGAPAGTVLPVDSVFDYSLVFPEQPSIPIP